MTDLLNNITKTSNISSCVSLHHLQSKTLCYLPPVLAANYSKSGT